MYWHLRQLVIDMISSSAEVTAVAIGPKRKSEGKIIAGRVTIARYAAAWRVRRSRPAVGPMNLCCLGNYSVYIKVKIYANINTKYSTRPRHKETSLLETGFIQQIKEIKITQLSNFVSKDVSLILHRLVNWVSWLTINGTGCIKHGKVSQLAELLPAAS